MTSRAPTSQAQERSFLARARAALVDGLLVSMLLFALFVVVQEYRRSKVVLVDPIRLPIQLETGGFKGDALAAQLIDEFTGLQRGAGPAWHDRWQTRELIREADLPDLEVPGAELSLRAAMRFVREAIGQAELRIRGEIVTGEGAPDAGSECGLSLLLSTGPRLFVAAPRSVCAAGNAADAQRGLDTLLQDAALELTESLEPCNAALIWAGRGGEAAIRAAEILAQRCVVSTKSRATPASDAPVVGSVLGQGRSADPMEKWSHVILGDVLHRRGDLAGAEASYETATKLDARFAVAHIYRGVLAYSKGELEKAIEEYRLAIELDPASRYRALALVNWGLVHYHRGETDAAIEKYRRALAADLEFQFQDVIYMNLGNALLDRRPNAQEEEQRRQERWRFARDAIGSYRTSISWNPRYGYGHHGLGRALWQLGRLDDAIHEFERAAALSPALADPVNAWANVLRDQGKPMEAMDKYAEAIRRDNEFAWAYEDWGSVLGRFCAGADGVEMSRAARCARCAELGRQRSQAYVAWGDRRGELGDDEGKAARRAEAAHVFECGRGPRS